MDKAHAAHIRSQLVDLVERAGGAGKGGPAIFRLAQVQQQEFVRLRGSKLRLLDIHPAHPHALFF